MSIPVSELIINPDGTIYHLGLKPEQIPNYVFTVGDPDRVEKVSRFFDKIYWKHSKREFVSHYGQFKGEEVLVLSTGMGTDSIDIVMNELDALVNVDFKTRELKENHRKLNIVRMGTSGSIQENVKVGTILVSDTAIGLDSLMNFYDLENTSRELILRDSFKNYLLFESMPYVAKAAKNLKHPFQGVFEFGNTVTCPGFYAPQGRAIKSDPKIKHLIYRLSHYKIDDFRLTNLEMETAAYYALSRCLGHDVVSINAILANRVNNTFSDRPNEVILEMIETTLNTLF